MKPHEWGTWLRDLIKFVTCRDGRISIHDLANHLAMLDDHKKQHQRGPEVPPGKSVAFPVQSAHFGSTPPESREGEPLTLTPARAQAQARLRKMVLDLVASAHSKRNYAKALDDLFAF